MNIEDLEKKLYSPEAPKEDERYKNVPAAKNYAEEASPRAWEQKPAEKFGELPTEIIGRKTAEIAVKYPLKKIIIWISTAIGVFVLGILAYFLYQTFTFRGIDVGAKYPDKILIGVPVNLQVNYSNNAVALLKDAKLTVTLPPEFVFVGEDSSKRVMAKAVGSIGTGTIGQETFKVLALGGAQTLKRIQLSLEYGSAALGSRFTKIANADVFVGDPAGGIDIDAPDKILSGEQFEVRVNYKNISGVDLSDVELRMEYPANFSLKTSSLKPDSGNNTWQLGDIKAGSSDALIIQGSVVAPANSFFDIKAFLASSVSGRKYDVNQKARTISVSSAPLAIAIALNNRTDYIAKADDLLTYSLSFVNNTDVGFRDVIVSAKLAGDMFDFSTLKSSGSFDSISNVVIWNASTFPDLKVLQPGQSGKIEFTLNTKRGYPIKRLNDKNFVLKVEADIESPTVPAFLAADRTFSMDKLDTKVSGAVSVSASAFFRDATSGILNKGSVPPKVNQPTQYTVHWVLKNFGTDVNNVEVRAFLRPGVTITDAVKSNIETKPEFNDRTQEVLWKIPNIQAGRGIIGAPLEAIFQIEAVPAVTQADDFMPLVAETSISAHDLFTDVILYSGDAAITSDISHTDPTVGTNGGRVVQ